MKLLALLAAVGITLYLFSEYRYRTDSRFLLCEPARHTDPLYNHTDRLYRLLSRADTILRAHRVAYVVHAGTLIGLLRDGRMNPFEVDIDLRVSADFTRAIHDIDAEGLVLFKNAGIWRICEPRADLSLPLPRPWFTDPITSGSCFPYMDLWIIDRMPTIVHRRMQDLLLPVPLDAESLLASEYGPTWREDVPTQPKCCNKIAQWLMPAATCNVRRVVK